MACLMAFAAVPAEGQAGGAPTAGDLGPDEAEAADGADAAADGTQVQPPRVVTLAERLYVRWAQQDPPAEDGESGQQGSDGGGLDAGAMVAGLSDTVTRQVQDLSDVVPVLPPVHLHPMSSAADPEAAQAAPPPEEPTPHAAGAAPVAPAGAPTAVWVVAGAVLLAAGAGAAGAAGSHAGGASLWRVLVRRWGIGLALFTRFERDSVLRHPRREALLELVRAEPGIHVQGLSDRTGFVRSSVVHHLKQLEQHGVLWSELRGRTRHFFATRDGHAPRDREAHLVMQNPLTRRIAAHLRRHPGATQQQVAEALAITPSMVHWHTTRMQEAGLVEAQRRGRFVHYLPCTETQRAGTPPTGGAKQRAAAVSST